VSAIVTVAVAGSAVVFFAAGFVGAIAFGALDRRQFLGRIPVVTPLGLVWVRVAKDVSPKQRASLLDAIRQITATYKAALVANDLAPQDDWARVMVEGMLWDLRRIPQTQKTVGQYLGYFGPRSIWVAVDDAGVNVGFVAHELEHMRDHIVSGLSYKDWAKANKAGRHFADVEDTQKVIAWCKAQLGSHLGGV
jgi:hypothetical protein